MLENFTIKNFRGIKELTLPSLKRVNLFVGKNGVGKTSVLEAVELWARRFQPGALRLLIGNRQELNRPLSAYHDSSHIVGSELHGEIKVEFVSADLRMQIGPDSDSFVLTYNKNRGDEMVVSWRDGKGVVRLDQPDPPLWPIRARSYFVPATGLDSAMMAVAWAELYEAGIDTEIAGALALLFPGVTHVNVVDRGGSKVPYVGFAGQSRRVPLRRLGDGAIRVFGLVLALASARDGLLLIDEFENGLHYSVQAEIWKWLALAADPRRFNVQVFATTHSRDAVFALAEASKDDDHIVYRLERDGDQITAKAYDHDYLDYAVEEALEIR